MKKPILLLIATAFAQYCVAQAITYPTVKKQPVTDIFFDKYKVTDDYRWMENLEDPELNKWADEETNLTKKYLAKATLKNNTKQDINTYAASKYWVIHKKGDHFFFTAFYDDISQPALYVEDDIHGNVQHQLVDLNFISHKDQVSFRSYESSPDSKYLAYEYSRNGSDWAEIGVVNIESGVITKDHIENVKFSGIYWHGNGFYYSAYPQVANQGRTSGQTVYYHKLGTEQSQDEVIFKRENNPDIRFNITTTKDNRFFVLQEDNKAKKTYNYFYIDYNDAEPALKPMLTNSRIDVTIIGSHDGKLIGKNFYGAKNGSIVEIDPRNATNWRTIAPSYPEALLEYVVAMKDRLVALYQDKLQPGIVVMDYNGKSLYSKSFPMGVSIDGLEAEPNDQDIYYRFESYTVPPVSYAFNIYNFERKLTSFTRVSYDYENYVYKQVEYSAADSTKIPMLLIYKKGVALNGKNPTLLETYGGFGAVNSPSFDPGLIYFLEKGGVFAYAYVRGGGDLGSVWAAGGRGSKKQNSFTDFIAGAEYLQKAGYTNSSKLAITGGSNGGLVVAAAAIERPDLFKAVMPVVAPFDMLRFENFTIGAFHDREYGTVKDSTSFKRLYDYSPYNNIKANVNYPSMLIITGDNDDRVPPLHSYKFTAAMQNRPAQTNPIYLLVNKQAGHYGIGGQNVYSMLQAEVNKYAFIVDMLK